MSALTSSFTLTVPMREVSCVEYSPRAWDPRSLQSILDVPLYFWLVVMDPKSARTTTIIITTITTRQLLPQTQPDLTYFTVTSIA